ncbi:MAG: hypothetical protein RLZ50_1133 [Bacteroidota bacterium]|jgi:hypothetical protein
MKKLVLALLVLTSCNINAQQKAAIVYDDNAQVRKVANFNAIRVSSAIDLYLTQSASNKVAVSASSDEIRDHIITEVEGGVLIIRLGENGSWFNWKKWGNYKTKAYVSIKDIDAITASGASDVHVINKIESSKIRINLSGASDFKGDISAGVIIYDISGAGASKIELAGKVDDLSVVISGASDAKLYNLNSKGAILKSSGASSIQATVTEILKANSIGASSIDYKGNPNVKESNTSGASSIRHKN